MMNMQIFCIPSRIFQFLWLKNFLGFQVFSSYLNHFLSLVPLKQQKCQKFCTHLISQNFQEKLLIFTSQSLHFQKWAILPKNKFAFLSKWIIAMHSKIWNFLFSWQDILHTLWVIASVIRIIDLLQIHWCWILITK